MRSLLEPPNSTYAQTAQYAEWNRSHEIAAVVLTGGWRGGASSEAEQMSVAWEGPAVELVVESTASTIAENAARTLPLLLERGIERAAVVCAPPTCTGRDLLLAALRAPRDRDGIPRCHRRAGARAFAWEIAAAPSAAVS